MSAETKIDSMGDAARKVYVIVPIGCSDSSFFQRVKKSWRQIKSRNELQVCRR